MSRQMPVECEHGVTVDWGDFGPDDSTFGETCDECEAAAAKMVEEVTRWRADALDNLGRPAPGTLEADQRDRIIVRLADALINTFSDIEPDAVDASMIKKSWEQLRRGQTEEMDVDGETGAVSWSST